MSYNGGNLSYISAGPIALFGNSELGIGLWTYSSTTDALATVLGANYISDGQKRGLTLGSLVAFYDGIATTWLQVSALQQVPPGPTENPSAASFGVTLTSLIPTGSTGNAAQYVTAALQSAAIPAASVAGADYCVFDNTGTTPANLQLPTAAALLALLPNAQIGFSWVLVVKNSSSGANTLTLTTNTGLTLTGTMTAAQNTGRMLIATFTAVGASAAVTFQSFGLTGTGAD